MNELNQHFNYPVFLGRVGQNVVSDSVRSRLFGLIGDQRSLFQALSLGSEARYRYKRIIKKGRELRLLFRLMPNPKALEFIEFIVAKNRAGQWQVIDWFQHAQAQLYSQSLVQVYLLLLAPEESTLSRWLSLLPFRNSPSEELLAFFKYAQLKENHKAFRAYERLPSSWQAQSTLMILALNIANRSEDEAQYRRQMARLVSHENNLAEGNLLLLDYYFYLGDHKKALKLIDEAHGLIGEDAQLSLLKANAFRASNQLVAAEMSIKKAIALEPKLTKSYFMLADCYLLMGRYRQALALYQEIQKKLDHHFAAQHFSSFPEFSQRDDVKQWLGIQ